MNTINAKNVEHIRIWPWICLVVVMALLSVTPVLTDSHFCILDCAELYDMAQNMTWYNPATYIYSYHPTRACYGMFLFVFPSCFSLSPALRFWFHSGFLLSVACILVFLLTCKATGRKWLGAVCAGLVLCHPSFTENYYTMVKFEPWILASALWVTYRVWQQLNQTVRRAGRLLAIFLFLLDVVAVMFVYSLKETGAAFFGVYLLGLPLLAWGAGMPVLQAVRRTWRMSLLNIGGCAALGYVLCTLPATYKSGDLGYVITLRNVIGGTLQLAKYLFGTASYLIPALAATITASILYLKSSKMLSARRQLAWTLYAAILFGGMISIVIPWTVIEPRYYLQGIVGGIMWTVLAANLCLSMMQYGTSRLVKGWAGLLLALIAVLLAMQAIYSVMVGQWSEGRVQQRFDAAYAGMFSEVARLAPRNAVVAFVIDPQQLEVKQSIPQSLRLFYKRGDIICTFPTNERDYRKADIICCSYRLGPLNYFRLPANENVGWSFINNIAPRLPIRMIAQIKHITPIFYATTEFYKPQYKSILGIPAFWDLKRGTYEFGWNIYYCDGKVPMNILKKTECIWRDLLTNGAFQNGLNGWQYWADACQQTNSIALVPVQGMPGMRQVLRIINPQKMLVGVQQRVQVESNVVYRLSGSVRSIATIDSGILFGGRIGFWLPPQPEQQIVWMSECTNWWPKSLMFTNQVTGTAVVYVHMGYGNVASTGEFADVQLERLEECETVITNYELRIKEGGTGTNAQCKIMNGEGRSGDLGSSRLNQSGTGVVERWPADKAAVAGPVLYTSVWQAVREAGDGDHIIVNDGIYNEQICFSTDPLRAGGRDIAIKGRGNPRITVQMMNVPKVNECAVNLSKMIGLHISNITLHAVCRGDNMDRAYNAWFSGCQNLIVEQCVFQSDVYGTNNTFKTYVATEGAANIVVRNCIIATADRTGMNTVHHTATHDAALTIFDNVDFCGMRVVSLEVGDVILRNCYCNEEPPQKYGNRQGTLCIDPSEPYTLSLITKLKEGATLTPADISQRVNLIANPDFDGLQGWSYWEAARTATNTIICKPLEPLANIGLRGCVRIENPRAEMIGVQQTVALTSGAVYRLSASARSVATNESAIAFGGRVAVFQQPQPEQQLVWISEYNNWWPKSLVFTNQVSGTAVVYVHMGYGKVASTGEFADVRLERVTGSK